MASAANHRNKVSAERIKDATAPSVNATHNPTDRSKASAPIWPIISYPRATSSDACRQPLASSALVTSLVGEDNLCRFPAPPIDLIGVPWLVSVERCKQIRKKVPANPGLDAFDRQAPVTVFSEQPHFIPRLARRYIPRVVAEVPHRFHRTVMTRPTEATTRRRF